MMINEFAKQQLLNIPLIKLIKSYNEKYFYGKIIYIIPRTVWVPFEKFSFNFMKFPLPPSFLIVVDYPMPISHLL